MKPYVRVVFALLILMLLTMGFGSAVTWGDDFSVNSSAAYNSSVSCTWTGGQLNVTSGASRICLYKNDTFSEGQFEVSSAWYNTSTYYNGQTAKVGIIFGGLAPIADSPLTSGNHYFASVGFTTTTPPESGTTFVQLYKVVGGSATTLITEYEEPKAFEKGNWTNLTVVWNPSAATGTINVYLNGNNTITSSDKTFTSPGYVGVGTASSTFSYAAAFDDLVFQEYPPISSYNLNLSAVGYSFDDGRKDTYDLSYMYMQPKGIPGTIYINYCALDGTCGGASVTQLTEMQTAGWDVANHGYSHTDLSIMTQELAESNLTDQKNALDAAGFIRASSHVAYAYGGYNTNVRLAMENASMLTGRRTYGTAGISLPIGDYYQIMPRSISSATSLATAEGYVDNALGNGLIEYYVFHTISDIDELTSTNWSGNKFRSLIDYTDSKKITRLTISQIYDISLNYAAGSVTAPAPVSVVVNDTSSYSPTSWKYNATCLQNGTEITISTARNFSFVFEEESKNWSVSLVSTNPMGTNLSTQLSWVNTTEQQEIIPVTSFTANTTGPAPLVVQFNDTSTNTPTNWDWYMWDNETKTSDFQDPVVTFNDTGSYNIRLYASNAAGGDWENKTAYIASSRDTTPSIFNWYCPAGRWCLGPFIIWDTAPLFRNVLA